MKRLVINIVLILLILLVAGAVIRHFYADKQYRAAKRLEKAYLWKGAEESFDSAIELAPFNSEYLSEYGNFLMLQSFYREDEALWLIQAEELYKKALDLNPGCAEYSLKLGEIQLKIEGRSVDEAFKNFVRALENDPNGFNTSYSMGYAGIGIWDLLNNSERELILDRLKFIIEKYPWYGFNHIYPRLWKYTKDFELLRKTTPGNLEANEILLSFVSKNGLYDYFVKQKRKVDFYRKKENPEEFESKMAEKKIRVENLKKTSVFEVSNVTSVSQKDWQGRSLKEKAVYESGNMYWSGTIDAVINVPEGNIIIKVRAKGSQAYNIWPYMVVDLDGKDIGETFVDSPEWKEYSFNLKSDGGIKVLSVTFVNDGGDSGSGEDRNLYVAEARAVKDVR